MKLSGGEAVRLSVGLAFRFIFAPELKVGLPAMLKVLALIVLTLPSCFARFDGVSRVAFEDLHENSIPNT